MAFFTNRNKDPKRSRRSQQILAIIGILLLVAMYLVAFVCAFINHPLAQSILWTALFSTIIIPVLIWVFIRCVQHFNPPTDIETTTVPKETAPLAKSSLSQKAKTNKNI